MLVATRASLDALPAWTAWRDAIASIAQRSDESSLREQLSEWAKAATSTEALGSSPIAQSIARAALHADMGGQLFVRTIEVPEAGTERANAADGGAPGGGNGGGPNPFLSLTFDEALADFMGRRIVTPDEYALMDDDARVRSFSATRLASQALVERAHALLTQTLRDGGTYDDFARGMSDASLSLGIEPASPGYLENVYRTNVAGAYGAGRFRQLTSPAVRQARPYVEYRTAGDGRVRPTHAALNGVVFSQADTGWHRYAPPLGFQCRCALVSRRAEEVNLARVVNSSDLSVEPDQGFSGVPELGDDFG